MVVGMLPDYKAMSLNDELKTQKELVTELQTHILGMESILNAYGIPLNPEFNSTTVANIGSSVRVEVQANKYGTFTNPSSTITGSGNSDGSDLSEGDELSSGIGDSETDEPLIQQRRDSVPDDTESEPGDSGDKPPTNIGF